MVTLLMFAFVIGLVFGCLGLNIRALMLVMELGIAASIVIGVLQVWYLGITHLGVVAENIGTRFLLAVLLIQIGIICGGLLLYGAPRSLRDVRSLLRL